MSRPQQKDSYVLEHTLGKQYLPEYIDSEDNVHLGVEDHRFAWWNSAGIPNITGVNYGVVRSYAERGCSRDNSTPIYFDCLDRLNFWIKLPELYRDSHSTTSRMRGLPVSGKNAISIPSYDGGTWGTFDNHDFSAGEAFEAPYEGPDENGVWSGQLPNVPQMDVYCRGTFYPNAMWNLQAGALRLWLLLMRSRFDATGAFERDFNGVATGVEWHPHYDESDGWQWQEYGNRTTVPGEMTYRGYGPSPWRIQSYFIDPNYTNPNPSSNMPADNTFKNIIGCTDTNFNYAIVSCQATNYPAGGAPFVMPDEKWYCHEIIDFSKNGTTLDSRLGQKLGTDSLGDTHGLPGDPGDYFSYSRVVKVVQYPRKKLPPDFWSFDQPPGVSHPNIWGTTGGN